MGGLDRGRAGERILATSPAPCPRRAACTSTPTLWRSARLRHCSTRVRKPRWDTTTHGTERRSRFLAARLYTCADPFSLPALPPAQPLARQPPDPNRTPQMKIIAGEPRSPIFGCMLDAIVHNVKQRVRPKSSFGELAVSGPALLQAPRASQ